MVSALYRKQNIHSRLLLYQPSLRIFEMCLTRVSHHVGKVHHSTPLETWLYCLPVNDLIEMIPFMVFILFQQL